MVSVCINHKNRGRTLPISPTSLYQCTKDGNDYVVGEDTVVRERYDWPRVAGSVDADRPTLNRRS